MKYSSAGALERLESQNRIKPRRLLQNLDTSYGLDGEESKAVAKSIGITSRSPDTFEDQKA